MTADTERKDTLHIRRRVLTPSIEFGDRRTAGETLAEFIVETDPGATRAGGVVLGLANGGVLVAEPVADRLGGSLDVVLTKKLPIPGTTEAGFGALTEDGHRILNEAAVRSLGLSRREIDEIAAGTERRLESRRRAFGADRPDITGRRVYLVDDGLASGYSMRAAAAMITEQEPAELILAVPVAPAASLELVEPQFDEEYCLFAQEMTPFAVASFYVDFHDVTDEEVRAALTSGGA